MALVKISLLPVLDTVSNTTIIPVVNGADTKKITAVA